MLKLNKINKIYNLSNKKEVHALKNVSLKFENNGLYIILGKSGSGKSSLLNILGGLDRPTSGHVFFEEQDISFFSS